MLFIIYPLRLFALQGVYSILDLPYRYAVFDHQTDTAIAFFYLSIPLTRSARPLPQTLSVSASGGPEKVVVEAMVLDSILSSPSLRSPSFRRQFTKDELGSWSTLLQRHRFLLTALVLLALLCTVYLYFAVTLGAGGSCSGLNGAQKASCHMELVKDSMAKGKLKIL